MRSHGNRSPIYWTSFRRGLALVGLVLAGGWSDHANAREEALDYIRPIVTREQYQRLCKDLEIASHLRNITEILYSDYSAAVADLAEKVDAQAIAAGRDQVENAFSGRVSMDGKRLTKLRMEVLITYRQCGPAADDMFTNLIAGIESVLDDRQKERFDDDLRGLRRKALLHPRQANRKLFFYAGDGEDVLQLIQQARGQDQELEGLDEKLLEGILNEYKWKLDEYISRTSTAYRDTRLESRILQIKQDSSGIHKTQETLLGIWKELYLLNQQTVMAIGDVAEEHFGTSTKQAWLDRFDRACFTWLFKPLLPDRQIEWFRLHDTTLETMQRAEAAYLMYQAELGILRKRAIEYMVRGRTDFNATLSPMMMPSQVQDSFRDLYEELLRNSGEVSNLETKVSGNIEALLDDEQRRLLRREMPPGRRRTN